ncbi:hypothetical protein MD588_18720 [Photobacterium sp. SDRW27]|uniref:hypothetical protein n=1 Tax=Photobacterium obscurum TaxID=2829490 RepID=UPI002243CEFA|nr:hypothetical protein [Photobacterium obscurum]MCW8330829.1 hypothetical protein [Photobacterium obscurum]
MSQDRYQGKLRAFSTTSELGHLAGKLKYVIVITLAYVVWWQWIRSFPLELTSDDALNFSRAVERFSVLEFRPHFPGYPAFIGFSRLAALWGEPMIAPVWVSLLSATLIPLLIARLVFLLSNSLAAATLGCLLALMQPLLASIALSGLSDSAAIMLFMLALMAAIQQKNGMVGIWIGLMLASRPSYFPLALGMVMLPWWGSYTGSKIRAYLQAGSAVAMIGLLSLSFIWFHDGAAYFEEGLRFTQGHFAIWGNTVEGDSSSVWQWLQALGKGFGWLGLVTVVISFVIVTLGFFEIAVSGRARLIITSIKREDLAVIVAIAWLYWLWITLGQNPDNLRHWAPVLFLFLVVMPVQLVVLGKQPEAGCWRGNTAGLLAAGSILYCLVLGFLSIASASSQAPIQQVIALIKANPQVEVVGTNYSVNLLRDQLGSLAIYDMYYPSSQVVLVNSDKRNPQSAWRISGTRLSCQRLVAEFKPRFHGERGLFVYQISQ